MCAAAAMGPPQSALSARPNRDQFDTNDGCRQIASGQAPTYALLQLCHAPLQAGTRSEQVPASPPALALTMYLARSLGSAQECGVVDLSPPGLHTRRQVASAQRLHIGLSSLPDRLASSRQVPRDTASSQAGSSRRSRPACRPSLALESTPTVYGRVPSR